MSAQTMIQPGRPSGDYLALLRAFPPRPIRDDDRYRRAIAIVNDLLDRPALAPDEED
jgi:hypothetical protein